MSVVPRIPLRKTTPAPASAPGPRPGAAYMRGNTGPIFLGWNPSLRDASDEVRSSWTKATARAHDLIHNSGWIAGAIDQAVANTVGTGLRLSSMPDATALGMTTSEAAAWARQVERRFELWARNPYECDIEGKRTFGQMQAAAFKAWFASGEIVGEIPWKERVGGSYATKLRLVPAHRLTQKTEEPFLCQGVRTDGDGMPISYVFRRKEGIAEKEVELRARDTAGRVRVIHVFDGVAGQMRGITPLVPALQVARQFDQLSDATLLAALIRTAFAATLKSDEPTEEIIKGLLTPQEQARIQSEGGSVFDAWLDAQAGWYDRTTIDLGIKGRFAHLYPGHELTFHTPGHQASDYKDMALFLLREILRCLGLTYESGTGDYTNATYSSVRMATGEIFLITLFRRKNIVAPFCQPAFEAWLEEDIDRGNIEFPGGLDAFIEKRSAACRAEWKGTPKPQADDLKTAKAHETYKRMRVITDEMICNDLGVDVEDVYEQLAREKAMREEFGIEEPDEGADPLADKLTTQDEGKD